MTKLHFTPPAPVTPEHDLAQFDCGELALNEWLRKRAVRNHAAGASRCFVLCAGPAVVAYYSLSAGAISHEAAPKPMRRNMPDPLPVLLLGRLAVDSRYHNQGIGQALLRDAMLRSVGVAGEAGYSPSWSTRFQARPGSSTSRAASWNRRCSR